MSFDFAITKHVGKKYIYEHPINNCIWNLFMPPYFCLRSYLKLSTHPFLQDLFFLQLELQYIPEPPVFPVVSTWDLGTTLQEEIVSSWRMFLSNLRKIKNLTAVRNKNSINCNDRKSNPMLLDLWGEVRKMKLYERPYIYIMSLI